MGHSSRSAARSLSIDRVASEGSLGGAGSISAAPEGPDERSPIPRVPPTLSGRTVGWSPVDGSAHTCANIHPPTPPVLTQYVGHGSRWVTAVNKRLTADRTTSSRTQAQPFLLPSLQNSTSGASLCGSCTPFQHQHHQAHSKARQRSTALISQRFAARLSLRPTYFLRIRRVGWSQPRLVGSTPAASGSHRGQATQHRAHHGGCSAPSFSTLVGWSGVLSDQPTRHSQQ